MYQFSAPMPYEKRFIDKYVYINSRVEKSKITGVYFAFPITSGLACGFEQGRNAYFTGKDFSIWENLILHSQNQGLKVTYLLNSPKPLSLYGNNLKIQFEKLDTLIKRLSDIGCTRFRVCNLELLEYLILKYPDLEFCTSTSNEYASLGQYINLMKHFPQITEIVPGFDVNRNFKLLKNLRKEYPKLDIELMVNEGCLAGCPFRNFHHISQSNAGFSDTIEQDSRNKAISICTNEYCQNIFHKNFNFEQLFKSNIIYPWDIDFYNKLNITKYKFIGRNNPTFVTGEYIDYYYLYLKGVDDYKYILDAPFCVLNNYIARGIDGYPQLFKEIKEYLPNIQKIKNKGSYCLSNCSVTCNYCFDCAKKFLKNNSKEKRI